MLTRHRVSRFEDVAIGLVGLALALALRLSLIGFVSDDITAFFGLWFDTLQEQGMRALATHFADYPPAYLYLLYLASVLFRGLPDVAAIKIPAILFDVVLAGFGYLLVRWRYPSGPFALFAFLAVLFTPTVVLNASAWGQIDSMYTAGLLATVYFLISRRPVLAMLAFGCAFAIKLQSIFLAPLLLAFFLRGRLKFWHFFLIPLVYVVSVIPAWIIGRPLRELLMVYAVQAAQLPHLALNVPNMYNWLPNDYFAIFNRAGIVWAAVMVYLFVIGVYKSRERLTDDLTVQLALLSLLIVPYFLPRMHDRYFFPADVMSVIFAFFFPRYAWVSFVVVMSSLFVYLPYLVHKVVIGWDHLALFLLVAIAFLALQTVRRLYPSTVSAASSRIEEEGRNVGEV